MKKSFVILTVIGLFVTFLTSLTIYFIKQGELLGASGDGEFFGYKDPFDYE